MFNLFRKQQQTLDETVLATENATLKNDVVDVGRRNFLKLLAAGTVVAVASKPANLFSASAVQNSFYDLSYGTFYNLENAKNRYSDLKKAFPKTDIRILELGGDLGERFRVVTYNHLNREEAVLMADEKKSQLKKFFEGKKFSSSEIAQKTGDTGIFIKNKEVIIEDITPESRIEKEAVLEKEISQNYYVLFSSYDDKEKADFDKRLLRKFGFKDALISEESVNGKTYYKALVGGFKDKEKAAIIAQNVLEKKELIDLLGIPQINVVKAIYDGKASSTDWSDALLIKKKFTPEKNRKKIAEHGRKKVEIKESFSEFSSQVYHKNSARIPKMKSVQIDSLIDFAVNEWNVKNIRSGYQIDSDLVRSMVWRESRYDVNAAGYKLKHVGNGKFAYAKNKKGNRILTAYGLLQVTPGAVKEVKKQTGIEFDEVLKDPLANLRSGIAYFGKYFVEFKGDISRSLGAYNAGPNRARKNNHLNFAETRQYVSEITSQYHVFKNNP